MQEFTMIQDDDTSQTVTIDPGETVYNADGKPLGRITGAITDGFEVETLDPTDVRGDNQEEIPGHGVGEGYIMWRCDECGEMGELDDGIPLTCPHCGAPEEALGEVVED